MSRDRRDTPPPETPDTEASPAERNRAEGFGKLIDGLLAGEPIPPAMDSEDRALLETATMVVASTQELRLGDEASRALVDRALEEAVTGRRRSTVPTIPPPEGRDIDESAAENTDVIRMPRRRSDRLVRALPWVVASVAAAAAILLFITRPADLHEPARQAAARRKLAPSQRSRPADSLVGRIAREDAARASNRLDVIYADRLAGFRDLRLSGRGRQGSRREDRR